MEHEQSGGVLGAVEQYYTAKLREFGANPAGVDWNGAESQTARFEQVLRVLADDSECSLTDIGCGYGALLTHIRTGQRPVRYIGVDISGDMIAAARSTFDHDTGARFLVADAPDVTADYCVASGIFNVRLDASVEDWQDYILRTLDMMDVHSEHGFAFNCLTSYADRERMRPHLYYADPCFYFDLCKRRYSRQVALLHDYGLYEFTILVRKNP